MRSAAAVLLPIIIGCSPPQPAQFAGPVTPSSAPSASAPPSAPSAAPDAGEPEPQLSDDEKHPCLKAWLKPGGVLAPDALPLMNVEEARSLSDAPLLLGFDERGRGAAITMPERATAGEECPEAWGEVFDLATSKSVSRVKLFKQGRCEGFVPALERFAQKMEKQGFVAPPQLPVRRSEVAVGATAHHPVVLLDAPLCGTMVRVAADHARKKLVVSLVSPKNDRSDEIGTFPLVGALEFASVREVALTPDRARLYVSISVTPGGHNESLTFHHGTFALPQGVVPAP